MSTISRPYAVILLLFLCFLAPAVANDAKSPTADPRLDAADQLYRAGKFADAEAGYQAVLKQDASLTAAKVGVVRSLLREQKIDEAWSVVNAAVTAQPRSAALLAEKGAVQYRLGKMPDAETTFLAAKQSDPKEVRAYLGLSDVYSSFSLYRQAYNQLQVAHAIAPEDIEVQRAWLETLPRKEKLAALEAYLAAPHPDDPEETLWLEEYLAFLKVTADKPLHSCRLISKVERTETKLDVAYGANGHQMRGIALSVRLNDRKAKLLLDTGAGGLMVSRRVAEKAGVSRLSAEHSAGIGDQRLQAGYFGVVDRMQIGELEFQDCVISVSDKRSISDEDGIIGADVLSAYVVDIDLPGMQLKLSPLPKRSDDAAAPTSLNSEGDDQANSERKQGTESDAASEPAKPNTNAPALKHLPKDRYVAPEMASWSKVYRSGHLMFVPTFVNRDGPMLFGVDTGSFANILSLRAGRQVSKVSSDERIHVHGLSGEVSKVYSAQAELQFGHLRQPGIDTVTFDLSSLSRHAGIEVSGLLGFAMLRILEIKLDYRDGLVDFVYDPKRISPFPK